MKSFLSPMITVTALAALLAGCSSDGGMLGSSLTTSSVDPVKAAAAAPKLDPACVALTAKIDALRKDGVTERAEKAAVGKASTVSVKRESLAKLTELDRTNSDYQSKCSAPGLAKPMPAATAAAVVAPAVKVSNAAPAAPAVKKVAAAKTTATLAAPADIAAPVAPVAVAPAVAAPAVAVVPAAVIAPAVAAVAAPAPVPAAAPTP